MTNKLKLSGQMVEIPIQKQFNFYSVRNYYGTLIFGIAATDAMPARYNEIHFTGSMTECKKRYLRATNVIS